MPFLEQNGSATELKSGELTVGSSKEVGLRLQQLDLAPHHLTVMVGGDGTAVVRPFGAQLIVTVNGRRITEPTRLAPGDLIGAGGARLRFTATRDGGSPAPVNESAWLASEDGAMAYTLAHRTMTIGRDASSTIQVKDPDTSRQHADICAEAGLHVLHSLGASGTKVNGRAITASHILEEGDVIEIGELTLRYTRVPPVPGTRVSSGGDEYDLDVSAQPTGRQRKLTEDPVRALNSPKVLRVVAIVVAAMAVVLIVLLIAL